ncbi:MAG TPA: type II secretion system protein [Desulfosarcina sp.]|nr:type II secretion system protein [Desulfosarcina sp.]
MPLRDNRAFTLIELIVVTALISIMQVVALRRLGGGLLGDGADDTARWIIGTVRRLKERSVLDQKTYLLNVSTDIQRMWVTEAGMADADADAAREEGYRLPPGTNIDQVGFNQNERLPSGTVSIAFYPQGYSDKAVIRLRTGDGDRLALIIEPFLANVDLASGRKGW